MTSILRSVQYELSQEERMAELGPGWILHGHPDHYFMRRSLLLQYRPMQPIDNAGEPERRSGSLAKVRASCSASPARDTTRKLRSVTYSRRLLCLVSGNGIAQHGTIRRFKLNKPIYLVLDGWQGTLCMNPHLKTGLKRLRNQSQAGCRHHPGRVRYRISAMIVRSLQVKNEMASGQTESSTGTGAESRGRRSSLCCLPYSPSPLHFSSHSFSLTFSHLDNP
ncbi:hypothetical protein BDW68DRAFT_8598 [Aspergillus falconensis]